MLWQEVKLRCGRKELEKGSVEACKQEQDQIRREKKKSHCLQTSRSVHFHSLMQAYHVASVPALQEAPLNSVDVYSWLWLELQRIVRRGCFPHLCHPFTIWAREQALHCRHPELRDMSLHVHWLSLAWLQATCTHGRCVIHSPETTLSLCTLSRKFRGSN